MTAGRSSFNQSTQLGYLNPDRSLTGLDAFADGVSGGNVDGEPYDNRVQLDGHVNTGSVFASDVWTVRDAWNVTLSARFNRTGISNRDRLNPGGEPGSLDGDHAYGRLNPAAGVTFNASRDLNLYAGYSEGSRAPTSIELGCADPNQPCKLPNALAGDPPLDQVVTRTVEAGVRGVRGAMSWNAGFFHADNSDDILFVASEQTGIRLLQEFRQDASPGHRARRQRPQGTRSPAAPATPGWTRRSRAKRRSMERATASNDAGSGLEGTIDIEAGNRIPLIPRHMFKAFADAQVMPRLSVDIDLIAASGVLARGNENNAHEPDGTYYLGPGSKRRPMAS